MEVERSRHSDLIRKTPADCSGGVAAGMFYLLASAASRAEGGLNFYFADLIKPNINATTGPSDRNNFRKTDRPTMPVWGPSGRVNTPLSLCQNSIFQIESGVRIKRRRIGRFA